MEPSAKTLLVVEDDPDIRGTLAEFLGLEGYRVIEAENGSVALSRLREEAARPAAILLDLKMPVMNGVQFREAQRLDPSLAVIPVIVLTADGDAIEKASRLQANGVIRKPIDLDTLLRKIEQHAA